MFGFKKNKKEQNFDYLDVFATDENGKQHVLIEGKCNGLLMYNTILSLMKEFLKMPDTDLAELLAHLTFDIIK